MTELEKAIKKEWDLRKKEFHENPFNYNKEIHHIWLTGSFFQCCSHFFVPGEHGHQAKGSWVRKMRELTQEDKLKAEKNFSKYFGCKEALWGECKTCLVHKYYLDNYKSY